MMDQENSKLLLMDQLDFTNGKLKEFEIQKIESRYADGFNPKYEVYFTACIPARLNDKDRSGDMIHILENVDGIHLETISIESSYRKTQEDYTFIELQTSFSDFKAKTEDEIEVIQRNINNIFYETDNIKHMDHNLSKIQEELASIVEQDISNMKDSLNDIASKTKTNMNNIESLADQVDGFGVVASSSGELSQVAAQMNRLANQQQLHKYQQVNDMMLYQMMSQIQALQGAESNYKAKILEDVRSEFRFEKAKLMTEMERFISNKKKMIEHQLPQQTPIVMNTLDANRETSPPDFMKTSNLNIRNSRPSSNQIQNAERNLLKILNQALDPNEPFGPPLMRSDDRSAGSDDTNYQLDISQMTDQEFKAELTRQYLNQKLINVTNLA